MAEHTPLHDFTEKGAAEGRYKGVAPGGQALPPHPPRLPLRKGPQRMTWPGFQVRDGVPTVFLEVTAAPEYRVEDAPGEVVVTTGSHVLRSEILKGSLGEAD